MIQELAGRGEAGVDFEGAAGGITGLGGAALSAQHGGPGVGQLRIAEVEGLGAHEGFEGAFRLSEGVSGEAEVVPGAAVAGIAPKRLFERRNRLGEITDFVPAQGELEGVFTDRRLEAGGHFEFGDGLTGAAQLAEDDRVFVAERGAVGIPGDGAAEVLGGALGLLAGELPHRELELAGRLIGVEIEEVPDLSSGHGIRIERVAQGPAGGHADVAAGILEGPLQGAQEVGAPRGHEGTEGARRHFPGERVWVAELSDEGVGDPGVVDPACQEADDRGLPVGQGFLRQPPEQAVAAGIGALAGEGDGDGAVAAGPVHLRSVPAIDGVDGPGDVLVRVTSVAGVGDAELAGEQGIRDGEAVVMPGVSLHVDCLRHVAVDAFTAGFGESAGEIIEEVDRGRHAVGVVAEHPVLAVGDGLDEWGVGDAAVMAAHAEPIARKPRLHRVRIMAIGAGDASLMHAAPQERGELVVFIANLAVRIERVGLVDDDEREVIEEGVAGAEVAGELASAGVAGAAGIAHGGGGDGGEGGVGFERVGVLLPPFPMGLEGSVAGFAADAQLRHGGAVGVVDHVVVLPEARVVAGGAHLVPVHAAAGPVAPLAGLPVFLAIDIEPLVGDRVIGRLEGLPASTRGGDKELPQGMVADDAVGWPGLAASVQAQGDHFAPAIAEPDLGGLGGVMEGPRGVKGGSVHVEVNRAFGVAMVRDLPQLVGVFVAFEATRGSGVLREHAAFVFEGRRLAAVESRVARTRGRSLVSSPEACEPPGLECQKAEQEADAQSDPERPIPAGARGGRA